MFRLLISDPDLAPLADQTEFEELFAARDAAKVFCLKHGGSVIVTQDVAKVEMAPVVEVLVAHQSGPVYRTAAEPVVVDDSSVPRVPQTRPRLLVLADRRATPAELVNHLMVVAEGKIVKNAFGALEPDDMPLTPEEKLLVARGLLRTL
jgi:hypothetical protein